MKEFRFVKGYILYNFFYINVKVKKEGKERRRKARKEGKEGGKKGRKEGPQHWKEISEYQGTRKGLDYKWTSENILGWWIYLITWLRWVLCDSVFIKTHRTVTSKCVNIIICKLLVSFKERGKCNFSASVKHLSNGNDAAVSVDNVMKGSFSECFVMHEVLNNCQILLLNFSGLLLYSATLLNSFAIYESLYIDSFSFLK